MLSPPKTDFNVDSFLKLRFLLEQMYSNLYEDILALRTEFDALSTSFAALAYDKLIDRGDPSAADFVAADLTLDASWRDLSLSSIVPAGATAVLIRVRAVCDTTQSTFQLRKNGNSNAVNRFRLYIQDVDDVIEQQGIVFCDTNRVIEYYGTASVTWSTLDIVVLGWWK